ncbi:unnamed protein product [Rangifer tarandus platyrhynchus]|uniref:Uncharacterized protein n=2 Tax=Rangifer tarandus platyrhynchus TaxID=3082113 RepID=A0ABN9A099_RANTA|nr:unnamed protein product [Rangifer tarandus platyrhynchus]CAI9714111.1 unnamed protein product [Rangifer tarandus platyrhynchus]
MTGSWVVPRMRVRSSSAADPGQEALRRSYRQTRTAVDSLRGPVGNSPSARRGGAEGADSPVRRRFQLGLRRAAGGWGAPRSRPPPLGCLLRVPRARGWGIRGGSVEGARWQRARRQLSDSDGDAGSAAPERRRAGGRDRERRRAVPAPSGLRPREAPPTSRPSPSALRATWSPRAPSPSCEAKTPTPRIGWGSAGRGSWTPRSWLTRDVGERAACACPPGHSSCGAGWEGRVGR